MSTSPPRSPRFDTTRHLRARVVLALTAATSLSACRREHATPDASPRAPARNVVSNTPTDDASVSLAEGGAASSLRAVQIVAGYARTCVRLSDGSVRCWGTNFSDVAPGLPSEQPSRAVEIAAYGHPTRLEAGLNHTCAWNADGLMRCWGAAEVYPGNGREPTRVVTRTEGFRDVGGVVLSGNVSCFMRARGSVECIDDESVQRGATALERVPGLRGDAVEVVGHGDDVCARTREGSVYCWGELRVGPGDSVTRDRTASRRPAITGATALFAGPSFWCIRTATAPISCWGQLAIEGSLTSMSYPVETPAPVPELATAVQIVSGSNHACARLADGSVSCWGSHERGQLGTPCSMPGYQSCMLMNSYGGGGAEPLHSYSCRGAPVVVPGLRDIVDLAAGPDHTCALRRDGRVFCWGSNAFGEIGDGTTLDRDVPVEASLARSATPEAALIPARPDGRTQLAACNTYTAAPLLRRASARTPPLVSVRPPSLNGPIDPAVVRRVALRNLGPIARCNEQMLAIDPMHRQDVRVRFVVGARGATTHVAVESSTAVDRHLSDCLIAAIGRWEFPPQSGETTVTLPIWLRAPE